jgi:pyruvate-ferredoxin/flavodoxin oxidoreductase
MFLGVKAVRETLASDVQKALELEISDELKAELKNWLDNRDVSENTRERADKLTQILAAQKNNDVLLNKIYNNRDFFVKRSQWILGGDGWAYDIGYGGLDHVLASGEDVNIFVFDTEVYSNTGGQASKATPAAAIAQFAATGKKTKKKDLGKMAMSYGYVYVAQVSMGADQNQLIKAITEAESYPGPSLIIAYSPCINHGIRKGMGSSQLEGKLAVQCGYWANWRYNPQLVGTGKNPFTLDSKDPDFSKFQEFLMGEVRYSSLKRNFPDAAQELFEKTQRDAEDRIAGYKILAGK